MTALAKPFGGFFSVKLLVIVLVALALRLGWGLSRPVNSAAIKSLPDQREYLQLGRNLLHHGRLEFIDPRFEQMVRAFRVPGYPLLIAGCGGNVRAVRVAQAFIDTSTAVAAGCLAAMMFDSAVAGLVAAAIVAVNPFLIYFSGLVLSDTLFTAMLAWSLVLLRMRRTFWTAGLLVLAAMVRPSGLPLAIVLPGISVLAISGTFFKAVRVWLITITFAAIVFGSWAIRNHHLLGAWMVTTTNTGFTLYDGFHNGATGASDQRFIQTMPQLNAMGEVGRSRYLQRQAFDWAKGHPLAVIHLAWAKLLRFWSPVPLSREFSNPWYGVIGGAYAVPLDLLVLYALLGRRSLGRSWMTLLAVIVYFSVLHALSVGSLRYRMPVEPVLAVIAAGAICKGCLRKVWHGGGTPEQDYPRGTRSHTKKNYDPRIDTNQRRMIRTSRKPYAQIPCRIGSYARYLSRAYHRSNTFP